MNAFSEKYTIGIDFGSLSARAVLMRLSDGKVINSCEFVYPHAVLADRLPGGAVLGDGWALQVPDDYRRALFTLIPQVVKSAGIAAEQVCGIGLDVTATTMLPVTGDGTPLCELPEFENEPHAYIKMWKHHGAQRQADLIQALAEKEEPERLAQFGGYISGEHFWPKAAQIAMEAPGVYTRAGRIIEVGDWLVRLLTGADTRNYCAAAYKTYYSEQLGDLSTDFLAKISPLLADMPDKLPRTIVKPGDRAGGLTEEAACELGLLPGTAVSAAGVDAHVTHIGCKINGDGDVLLIIGTSTCIMMCSGEYTEIRGINGVVPDGILPGLNAYEGGQSAVGDQFSWFCKNCVPQSYYDEAEQKGMSIQQLLTQKAAELKPGQSGLIALDWINGVRSTLMDFELSGLLCGYTMNTKPEEIYRALIESTAFGAYKIVSSLEERGVKVNSVFASGGIPAKNPLLMQIYADVFNRDIHTVTGTYTAAEGSAILGAAAAQPDGGFGSLTQIMEKYRGESGPVYRPDGENAAVYSRLYEIYSELYEQFGTKNSIMKRLRSIKHEK